MVDVIANINEGFPTFSHNYFYLILCLGFEYFWI